MGGPRSAVEWQNVATGQQHVVSKPFGRVKATLRVPCVPYARVL